MLKTHCLTNLRCKNVWVIKHTACTCQFLCERNSIQGTKQGYNTVYNCFIIFNTYNIYLNIFLQRLREKLIAFSYSAENTNGAASKNIIKKISRILEEQY